MIFSQVRTLDIARAAGVSPQTVRRALADELTERNVKRFRFPAHDMPRLVEKVQGQRRRRRANDFNQ